MKKRLILAAFMACLIAVSAASVMSAGAQTAAGAESGGAAGAYVTVTGTASVKAQADECRFYGSIEVAANDLNSAEKKSAEIFRRVAEAFEPYGTVRENDFNVYPLCGQTGYTASRYLSFMTKHTDKLGEIRSALAAAGITGLNGVTYTCTDDAAYENRAIALALENAREKAAALNAMGELIEVEELSCYPCYYDNSGNPAGVVTYTATVRACFAEPERATGDVRYY